MAFGEDRTAIQAGQAGFPEVSQSSSPASAPPVPLPQLPPELGSPSLLVEVTRSYNFIWPAQGPLTSLMDSDHPLGIDIGLEHDSVAPIIAVTDGVVTFTGGDPCCDYGYHVTVEHAGGYRTLYAHFSTINVASGEQVRQGQLLGYGGSTGYSTGKHLHFEIHHNGSLQDPLRYLSAFTYPHKANATKEVVDCGTATIALEKGSPTTLLFAPEGLNGYELRGASVAALRSGQSQPPVEVSSVEDSTVSLSMLNFPASAVQARLLLEFVQGDSTVTAECRLELQAAPKISVIGSSGSSVKRASDSAKALAEAKEEAETTATMQPRDQHSNSLSSEPVPIGVLASTATPAATSMSEPVPIGIAEATATVAATVTSTATPEPTATSVATATPLPPTPTPTIEPTRTPTPEPPRATATEAADEEEE